MPTYVGFGNQAGAGAGNNFTTVSAGASTTVTNADTDPEFEVGDDVEVTWGAFSGSGEVIGTSGDGFVVHVPSLSGGTEEDYLYVGPSALPPETLFVNNPDPSVWFVTCFLTGTRIAVPQGERTVEALTIGDIVLTASGETRPVRWIGRQTVASPFANRLRTYPIRIAAGALGAGLPKRDLLVSPDHAMLVGGFLVQANAMVNGTTVTRVDNPDERFTYWHIELEDHALILAEGAATESFVDNVTRRRFDNYAEYEALYGEAIDKIPELDLPRVKSARQLPQAVRATLGLTESKAA